MAATLLQLSELITTSVGELVNTCTAEGLEIPSLNDAFYPESEAFRSNVIVAGAANKIAAAAFQLAACLLPPQESAMQLASGPLKSAALGVAMECHIPEILREAGEQGLHANDIAAKTGADGQRIARILRVLANRHIFREVKPDVFANNRISGLLDTGKPIEKILNEPETKHDETPGIAAFVEFMITDVHKASAYLTERVQDSAPSRSDKPHETAFQRAFGIHKSYWDFLSDSDQGYRRQRFGMAMNGFTAMDLPDLLLKLFEWDTLPNGALVVDVGGGIGSSARIISKAYPNLKFVVQDSPPVVEHGVRYWDQVEPEAIQSGRVKIQVHNFFMLQPIKNASVFFIKNVLHDWSDDRSTEILSHLRHAAAPDTLLLICDVVMMPSMQEPSGIKCEKVSEAQGFDPPSTLQTGYTSVTDMVWTLDMIARATDRSQERTVNQFDRLLASAGWKAIKVLRSGGSIDSVLAKPV